MKTLSKKDSKSERHKYFNKEIFDKKAKTEKQKTNTINRDAGERNARCEYLSTMKNIV